MRMHTYCIKYVDAFTTKKFSGNPAGVVLDAKGLSDDAMQAIAREISFSETAFVLPATERDAQIQIRWFTPEVEVPLCGHATIAAFHALAEEGMVGMETFGQHYFRVQTKSGILAVCVEKNFHCISVEFEIPNPRFRVKKNLPVEIYKSLGIKKNESEPRLPIVIDNYLYLPIKRISTLAKLKLDVLGLAKLLKSLKVSGVCVFTLETIENNSSVHSRFFAPCFGIVEDPVTGSANGPLGYYLYKYALPAGFPVSYRELADGRIEFVGEQGDEINRRGRVRIRLRLKQKDVEDIAILGEAVTVLNGTITI